MAKADPLYGREYYKSYFGQGDSIPYERNDHWLEFFGGIADQIVQRLSPASVLDVGCALGFLVEALRERGVDASGIDASEYAIGEAHETVAPHLRVESVLSPISGRYDLVTCIEVIEHLPAGDAPAAVRNIAEITDRLLLSTTPSDYEEPTHFNVQPPGYWAGLLAEVGFMRVHDFDASFLTPWAALYERRELRTAEVVTSYERERWQLVQERNALRDALLKANKAATTVDAGAPADEVALLRTELRTAIDACHASDARRAAVESRLAHVEYALDVAKAREQQVQDLVNDIDDAVGGDITRLLIEHRQQSELIESRSFAVLWRLLAPYRRLRGGR